MTARPSAAVMIAGVAMGASLSAACTRRPIAQPAAQPSELIVLLPDPEDNSVGAATVSNAVGTADLSHARDSTRVSAGRAPAAAVVMEQADVDRTFGSVVAALPPAPRQFRLNFERGAEGLTAESRALVPEILRVAAARPRSTVVVIGHTDTTGSSADNYQLGLRRANLVRALLVMAGLEASAIEVASHGESDLLVPTADNVSEARNRRVEIDIQ
jgi:outer membrane protein OmpA-like peptidoglycan-associated protein